MDTIDPVAFQPVAGAGARHGGAVRACRAAASLFSPAGQRAALSILIFHRVLARPDPLLADVPDAARFDMLLSWIGATFNVLPLEHALRDMRVGALPARSLAITFDDGYADNCTVALPLLRRHRLSATFFIATDYLDGGRMWNDTVIEAVRRCDAGILDLSAAGLGQFETGSTEQRRATIARLLDALKYLPADERADKAQAIGATAHALPDDLMMTTEQLRALRAAGMQIGGHTRSHPILARLPARAARDEIAGGKARLEGLLGEPIALFAYPNGKPGQDYTAAHADMVRQAGYAGAVSTSPGVARRYSDPFQVPRFTPWDRSGLRFTLRLIDNLRRTGATA